MSRFIEQWKKQPLKEQIISAITIVLSLAVIVLALLQIFNVWDLSLAVAEILMAIVLTLQAIGHWAKNRKIAIFNLCVAVFIFVVAIVVFFA